MTEIIDICTEVITDKILNLMDSDSGKLNRESWFFETYARGTNRILPSAYANLPNRFFEIESKSHMAKSYTRFTRTYNPLNEDDTIHPHDDSFAGYCLHLTHTFSLIINTQTAHFIE